MLATTVRPATAEDVSMLGIIGPAAYAEAYSYLWDRADAYSEQLQTFGQRAFETLLARADARVWVGEAAGTIVGFLSMIIGSLDPVEHRPRGAELPRIYILSAAQHIGLGRLLIDAAVKQAGAEGLSYVWLDVMASADRARRAYAKWGFREIGTKQFSKTVAAGLSNMIVLAKDVAVP
jgi:ribosomal protein S18 acetylase RimI-like enzyme